VADRANDGRTGPQRRRVRRAAPGRGFLVVALVPLLLIALATLDLVARGRSAITVLFGNLPPPPVSSGERVVDLVRPTAPEGRVFRIAIAPDADATAGRTAGARAQLQLASLGRTRLLLVQPASDDASRATALVNLATGRASLQLVDDRGWVDLGALPADAAPLAVHVIGLLPGAFAFAELDAPASGGSTRIDVALVPSGQSVVTTTPRFRVVRDDPQPAREMLARLTFFVRTSPLLLVATLSSVVGLCAGWALLAGASAWSGVALLVASVTILHAALLPPLQGADETSQIGTADWLVADPSPERAWQYPQPIARVARALEQDRVQYHGKQMLPLGDAASRTRLSAVLQSRAPADDGAGDAPLPPAADLQVIELRAPLFFAPFPALGGVLRDLPVLDRIVAYRLVATLWCLAGFVAGLVLLRAGGVAAEVALAYGLVFLLPYAVGVAATCSNYAPAIGIGFLVAAAAVTSILGATPPARRLALGTGLAAAWAGVPLWPDFLALALLATLLAAGAIAVTLLRHATATARAAATAGAADADARGPRPLLRSTVVALLLVGVAAGVAWIAFPEFNYQLRLTVAAWDARQLALRAVLLATPLALAGVAAAFLASLAPLPEAGRRRRALAASATIAALLVAGFAVTPYAEVPFERVFLPLGDLVRAHLATFLASSFSFDQDRLGWKFLFGTFGWHDAYYPEAVYALARWGLTLLLIALPVLTRDFAAERPRAAVALLTIAGASGSLAVATLLARHAMSVHPHGRFVLPYLALTALPVLVTIATPARRRTLRIAIGCAVALNVWTAIAVLGARYFLPR